MSNSQGEISGSHDHDQLFCSICFAIHHRACEKFRSINEVSPELNTLCSQITPTCFTDALKNLEDVQKKVQKQGQKAEH